MARLVLKRKKIRLGFLEGIFFSVNSLDIWKKIGHEKNIFAKRIKKPRSENR